jgi:hypothetical protein
MGAAVTTYGLAAGMVQPLKNPEDANVDLVQLVASTVFPAGTIIAEVTATPGVYAPYNVSNTPAGINAPTHILQYSVATDSTGQIFMGTGAVGEWTQPMAAAPAYRNGYFNCADLIGLTAVAVPLLGRLVQGTFTAGHIMVYGG